MVVALEESSLQNQNSDLFTRSPANKVVYATATLPCAAPLSVVGNVQTTNSVQRANRDLILDAIHDVVESADTNPEGNPKPSNGAISEMTKLLAVVPDSLLGEPEVSVYYGEVHLEWERGTRRIVLMAFSKDTQPLVHNYERSKGTSKHGTEKATATSLEKWLRWLNA